MLQTINFVINWEFSRFSKQGILKDQANCAPNNGYYFFPLYDKGEYELQVSTSISCTYQSNVI